MAVEVGEGKVGLQPGRAHRAKDSWGISLTGIDYSFLIFSLAFVNLKGLN
jgi:hypothetical protein